MGIGAVIAGVRAAALRLRSHQVGAKGAPCHRLTQAAGALSLQAYPDPGPIPVPSIMVCRAAVKKQIDHFCTEISHFDLRRTSTPGPC